MEFPKPKTSWKTSCFFLNDVIFWRCFWKNIEVDVFGDVLQNAKHRANDASNEVNCPPLYTSDNLLKLFSWSVKPLTLKFDPKLFKCSVENWGQHSHEIVKRSEIMGDLQYCNTSFCPGSKKKHQMIIGLKYQNIR